MPTWKMAVAAGQLSMQGPEAMLEAKATTKERRHAAVNSFTRRLGTRILL